MKPRLALFAAVLLAWAPALRAPFTYDDRIEVVGNRTLRALGEVGAIAAYNTSRPLLVATYALDWWIGGLEPLGYHLVSLAIHVVNVALVLALLGRWLAPSRALLGAALWALHPMTTEAVTYVAGRSDALCATFLLGATLAWVDHLRGRRGPALAVACVGAGLLTKETAAVAPLLLWAVGALLEGRPARARALAPFVALLAAAAAVRLGVYGFPAGEVARAPLDQLTTQAVAWAHGLQLWLLPIGQSLLHDHGVPPLAAGLAAVVGWAVALVLAARAGGVWAFAAVWWAALLLPASLLPLKETFPEHRTYLAGLAPILLVAAKLPARAVRPAWALVPLLFVGTVLRNRTWTDEVALWSGAAAHAPRSPDAWYAAGDALRLAGRHADAEAAYRESLALDPSRADTRVNLGITRVEQGDAAGAKALWMEVLRADPGSCAAHNNLAGLDARTGRLGLAIAGYRDTLAWCPDDALAHLNLGNLYLAQADAGKAALHYRAYLRVAPDGAGAATAREALERLGVAP